MKSMGIQINVHPRGALRGRSVEKGGGKEKQLDKWNESNLIGKFFFLERQQSGSNDTVESATAWWR